MHEVNHSVIMYTLINICLMFLKVIKIYEGVDRLYKFLRII